MNPNKMYVFLFFFFTILCFAPLISSKSLSEDYYKKTCAPLEHIVLWGVWNANQSDPRMPASLLRLHFHDCFVNGCEASLLLDGGNGEQNAGPNKNSVLGLDVIDNIKADVEKYCPNTVSCADILALAARASVKISLGSFQDSNQPWPVALGRLDGMTSNQSGANSDIPSPSASVDTLITKFASKGLNIQDMVALSGAHTIGLAKCSTIKSNRLYSSNKKNNIMDADLLRDLRKECPNVKSSDNNTVSLDRQTPYVFDNNYYINIEKKAGVLQSDQALVSDIRTSRWTTKYKDHQPDFFKDFGIAMEKMGTIGVIVKGSAIKGEIRKTCGSTN